MNEKSLVFLTLGLICFWLVLDQLKGKKYISSFVTTLIPSAED